MGKQFTVIEAILNKDKNFGGSGIKISVLGLGCCITPIKKIKGLQNAVLVFLCFFLFFVLFDLIRTDRWPMVPSGFPFNILEYRND